MDFDSNRKITRRKFVKGVAGAAVCCSCFSLDCLAVSGGKKEDKIKENTGRVHLAAACGTYCGACPAYLAKHGDKEQTKLRQKKSGQAKPGRGIPPSNWMDGLVCDGCLSGGMLAGHCQMCSIRLHALKTQKNARCSECEELPCYRIKSLINMGNYHHRKEYLPNLKKYREMGIEKWVKYEEERWRCPNCGAPVSWYDEECVGCGAPRSGRLFPLTYN